MCWPTRRRCTAGRTAQIKLQPFDFEETCRYFDNFSAEEKALAYGIVAGHRSTFCR
jgi:hypothetical protein